MSPEECQDGHVRGHAFLAQRYGVEVVGAGDDEYCRVCDHHISCHADQGRGTDSARDGADGPRPLMVP